MIYKMIYIKEEHIKEMIEHVKKEYPSEACGILAGRRRRIKVLYKISNIDLSPKKRYFANPKEQLNAMKKINSLGLKMYGIYYSHPYSSAYPSKKDMELAFYPDSLYFIISLKNADYVVKVFQIRDKKVKEKKIKVLEE